MGTMKTRKYIYDDRTRFNWGFFDGQSDRNNNRMSRDMTKHFDSAYAKGYRRGNGATE